MRNRLKHLIVTSFLGMTLLFTMGLSAGISANHQMQTASNPPASIDSFSDTAPESAPVKKVKPIQVNDDMIVNHINKNISKTINAVNDREEIVNTYEVTAHVLNVRAKTDKASEIVDVVKQGAVLEVLRQTAEGWLELKSGGYVNGKYAKIVAKKVVARIPPSEADSIPTEPIKPTSAVKSGSGLTEEHIAKIFEGTALEGEGLEKAILDVEKEYGINAYFTIAVMKLESGHGKSRLAKDKNNLFGLNAAGSNPYQKALSFKTKGDSVKKFGQLIAENYLDKGLTSIEKVAKKYCSANSKWPTLVKSIMKSDYNKIA